MSEFEYLSSLSLGQYLPSGSAIHRVNPGFKLAGYLILILALTLSKQISGLSTEIAFICILLFLSRTPIKFALQGLRTPLPFILLLAVIQLFMVSQRGGEPTYFEWGFLTITRSGIYAAGLLCLRFIGLVLLLTLSSASLSTLEIVHGLDILLSPLSWLGMHTSPVVMTIQIMLRFLPSLAISAEKIAKSQASRGAVWGNRKAGLLQKARQLLPLLVPLFTVSLQQADALANAMLARAYGLRNKRSSLIQYSIKWTDLVFFVLCLTAAFLTLFFNGLTFQF